MAGKFEPKVPVNLNPPKDDPISLEELAKADGKFGYDLPTISGRHMLALKYRVSKVVADKLNIGTEGNKAYVAIKV